MGGNCRNCNSVEEDIYWKHFQTVQFYQTLSLNFENQLEVPKRFVKNLRENLGKEVSLKGPSGAIWKVGLVTERGSLYFKIRWNNFIEDNSLVSNDILIFKYNGSSKFDVLLFDGKSLCEKESSYFVRKCADADMAKKWRRGENGKSEKISDEELRGCQTPQNEGVREVEESLHIESASEDDNSMAWIPSSKSKKTNDEAPSSVKRSSTAYGRIRRTKRAAEVRPTPLKLISNRRPVTETEKVYAELRAKAEASDESLVIAMKEHHVYRCFMLTLPAWWSNDHLPPKSLTVKLQLEGKVWPVKFAKKYTGGMLTSGWKKFVLDNALEEDDACLFNLLSAESSDIVMDVKIFRVVKDAVPPTTLRPVSSSRRGGRGRRKLC